jgi:nucleoside-diphosphate-sugar epimerase
MSRILITGASGFIGTHCLRRLLLEDCEIHAVNRDGVGPGAGRIHWHPVDLLEPSQVRDVISAVRPSHLLHCAWIAIPGVYAHSPENENWLRVGEVLAEGFGQFGGRRLVGVGTSAEYDPDETPCIEDSTPIRPATVYGRCKAQLWATIQAAAEKHGFSSAWARVFFPYGPGDAPGRLIPSLMAALLEKTTFHATHGLQVRDLIYVPEAADLLIRLLFSTEEGAFNVGTGRGTTIRYVIEYLAEHLGQPRSVCFGAHASRPGDPPALVADMSKVAAKFGWTAQVSVEAGLDELITKLGAPSGIQTSATV